jgi:hypothetical protein
MIKLAKREALIPLFSAICRLGVRNYLVRLCTAVCETRFWLSGQDCHRLAADQRLALNRRTAAPRYGDIPIHLKALAKNHSIS